MGLLDFINNGQQRRSWLDENVADFVEYITPPNLRPAAEFAAQLNPVQGMSDMMSSYGVATDPARSMDERRRAAINAVTEGAIALAPAALGAAGYMKPAQAAMEGLLGGSPATKQIGDDMGRFLVDEAGSVGFDPISQRGDEILDLLKRDPMRVTDEMLDMGADTPRLNEYLFRNYDLPMDQASRMARAEEMGLRPGWYRGAWSDAPEFSESPVGRVFSTFGDPEGYEVTRAGTFFSDNPAFADEYAATIGRNLQIERPEGSVVGEYLIPRQQELPHPYSIRDWAEGVGDEDAYDIMRWSNDGWEMLDDEAGEAVLRYAADDPSYRGAYTFEEYSPSLFDEDVEVGGVTAVVPDPTNIRSKFARFDPRLSHLKNLSAGIGAAGLFGLLSPQEQQGGI